MVRSPRAYSEPVVLNDEYDRQFFLHCKGERLIKLALARGRIANRTENDI